jgi:hypothetical protein
MIGENAAKASLFKKNRALKSNESSSMNKVSIREKKPLNALPWFVVGLRARELSAFDHEQRSNKCDHWIGYGTSQTPRGYVEGSAGIMNVLASLHFLLVSRALCRKSYTIRPNPIIRRSLVVALSAGFD